MLPPPVSNMHAGGGSFLCCMPGKNVIQCLIYQIMSIHREYQGVTA